jgi:D-xylose transport system substrate-binding protein
MTSFRTMVLGSCLGLGVLAVTGAAWAQGGPTVGVSWSNFQEERWKTDEAAMKAAIEAAGGTYVSADAQSSPAKQLADIESLLARGVDALVVLSQDSAAVAPAVQAAVARACRSSATTACSTTRTCST